MTVPAPAQGPQDEAALWRPALEVCKALRLDQRVADPMDAVASLPDTVCRVDDPRGPCGYRVRVTGGRVVRCECAIHLLTGRCEHRCAVAIRLWERDLGPGGDLSAVPVATLLPTLVRAYLTPGGPRGRRRKRRTGPTTQTTTTTAHEKG